jgi:hypothetical protein
MSNIVQDFTKHFELSGHGLIHGGTTHPSTIASQAKSPKSRSFPTHVWAFKEDHPHVRIQLGPRNLFSRQQPPPEGLEISGKSRQGPSTRGGFNESPLAPVLKAEKHPALMTHKKEETGTKHVSIEGTAAAVSIVNEDGAVSPRERRPRPVFPTQNWTKYQLSHGGLKMAGSSF